MESNNLLQPANGFYDYYPENWEELNQLLKIMKNICLSFSYQEYEGPSLEYRSLYEAKSGENLMGEVFQLKDRFGKTLVLRPEQTPTLARMLAKEQVRYTKPIRWFSIPRLFRDETPQRGRSREFWQLNVDILGEDSVMADIETIAIVAKILFATGLKSDDFAILVNHRKLITEFLVSLGLKDKIRKILEIVDKKLKLIQEEVERRYVEMGKPKEAPEKAKQYRQLISAKGEYYIELSNNAESNLLVLVEERETIEIAVLSKSMNEIGITDVNLIETIISITNIKGDPKQVINELSKIDLPESCIKPFEELRLISETFESWGINDVIEFDLGLARGLDYYTGIVYEAFDRTGRIVRALCGGGRYENLVEAVGGLPLSGVGFGMGEAAILEVLKSRRITLTTQTESSNIYVAPIKKDQIAKSIEISHLLRNVGYTVLNNPFKWKVKKHLEVADQSGSHYAILIGPKDVENNQVSIRDMRNKETIEVKESDLINYLKQHLN